jgi:hypothetical protein
VTERHWHYVLGDEGASAEFEISAGRILDIAPEWQITEVTAGPDMDQAFPNDELCGCPDHLFFGDQMLFVASTLELVSVRWAVPEVNMEAAEARSWCSVPICRGVPRLRARSTFSLSSASKRRYLAAEDVLVGLFCTLVVPMDGYRIQFAEDLSLLFAGDIQVGWVLDRASRHLRSPVTGLAPEACEQLNDQGRALLEDTLELIDQGFLEVLEQGEPKASASLTDAIQRSERLGNDGVAKILAEWMRDIMERFTG